MLGIILSAVILCVIMYVVARHEAEYSLPVVLMVCAGLAVCNLFLSLLPVLIALPLMIGLMMWALHQFCYLRWKTSGIVTAIYISCQIVLGLALAAMRS